MSAARKFAPVPTPETLPFWEKAAQHELWLPRCADTGKVFFPPRAHSPFSGGAVDWVRASGRGDLASYVINHRPAPGYEDEAPYAIALVRLEEGPILTSNIKGIPADPAHLRIGMKLEVQFEARGEVTVPQFGPVGKGEEA